VIVRTLLVSVAILSAGVAPTHARVCAFDPSFAGSGVVRASVPGGVGVGAAVSIDAQGRYVVAGFGQTSGAPRWLSFIARYQRNGNLDSSFGQGGIAVYVADPSVGTGSSPVRAAATNAAGEVFVLAQWNVSGTRAVVLKFGATGLLDVAFGNAGIAEVGCGPGATGSAGPWDLIVDDVGRLLIASQQPRPAGGTGAALARMLASGSMDESFGVTGCFFATSGSLFAAGVRATANGYVYGGSSTEGLWTARVDAKGVPIAGYGSNGFVPVALPLVQSAVAMLIDGDRVLIGYRASDGASGSDFGIARLASDGALDPGFGDGGAKNVSIPASPTGDDYLTDVAIGDTGQIAMVGAAETAGAPLFALARLDAQGQLADDSCDAATYFSITASGVGRSEPRSVLIDGDRIVSVGVASDAGDAFGQFFVTVQNPAILFGSGFED
jgi:uncharacterized delta-60 repeat protein